MRYPLYIIVFILLMPGLSCASNSVVLEKKDRKSISDSKPGNASNRILVKFKPGTDPGTIKNIQKKLGLVTVKSMNVSDLYLMKCIGDKSINAIINELKSIDEVQYAEPDHKYHINK